MESMSEDVQVPSAPAALPEVPPKGGKKPRKKSIVPKVRDFIPNLVTGAFLKSVQYLNPECTKYIIIGIFQNFQNSVGILFNGKKGFAYWKPSVLNQLLPHFDHVSAALEEPKGVRRFGLDNGCGDDIVVRNVFGKRYAVISDGNHSIPLTASEWVQFTNSIPCLSRHMNELFLCEDLINQYIESICAVEAGEYVQPPAGLPPHLCDSLFDEVCYYKRWPNCGVLENGVEPVNESSSG
jgi:hypothetical protein